MSKFNNRIGETKLNYQGCLMKIVEYKNANNIIVEFQDEHKYKIKSDYRSFSKGRIKNAYNRIGETNITNEGCLIKIIDCNVRNEYYITIEFQDEYHYTKNTTYSIFKDGRIKNPYHKSICGKGFFGETNIDKKSLLCWKRMIERCYSENFIIKNQTYKDCSVCDNWLCYANFKKWYDENYYEIDGENIALDKDILVKGNRVYSPETCIFVPQRINNLFVKSNKIRGNLPIGVTFCKRDKVFKSACIGSSSKSFKDVHQAFLYYKQAKEKYIKQVANEYKDKIPQKLYDAMYKYEVEITD